MIDRAIDWPSGVSLRKRLIGLDSLVSMPALGVILFYLFALADPTRDEWFGILVSAGSFAIAVALGSEPFRRRMQRPLAEFLDARIRGETDRTRCRQAFRCVMGLPRSLMILSILSWATAGLWVPVGMALLGHRSWLTGFPALATFVAAFTGGLIASSFLYFASKRVLAGLRQGLAAEIPDPAERDALVAPTWISRKLQYVIVGSTVASLVFVMLLAYGKVRDGAGEMAGAGQARLLGQLAPVLAQKASGRVEGLVPTWPYPIQLHIEPVEGADSAGPSGSTRDTAGGSLSTWLILPDGRRAVATGEIAGLQDAVADTPWLLGLMLVLSGGLSLGIATLLGRDVRECTEGLRMEAERLAQGDLRRGRIFESEDELGSLARSFERMGGALRATVGRVAEAADRVDGAAAEIAGVSARVSDTSAEQVRRVQRANELMAEIMGQVQGVTRAAQGLNESVEESSSSILELGAAGDELNETASVLSGKVDEVSGSIEQMVRSVKQVHASSEQLAGAAAETSSSMEEMASAMRAVDTTAEATASLSREVVSRAEGGQDKVTQTIEGMQAIRSATDTAERVIRGLGARTEEIGAILDVIDDVADETNLLALNAAIIAAQAGEHGRAFSVVADEIKELADRVLASTKEIGGLIRAVQDEASNAIGAIEVGSRSVASGEALSNDAGQALEEINRASRESGTHIQEIVIAVREQTKAAAHVVDLMESVRGGVEQIGAAGIEQDRANEVVFRSSITMRDVAQQVRRTTEEQARGFGRIRDNVEGVRDATEQIGGSLDDQSRACGQVAESLEQILERSRSNEESAQKMGESMRGLVKEAEALREDVAKFQI